VDGHPEQPCRSWSFSTGETCGTLASSRLWSPAAAFPLEDGDSGSSGWNLGFASAPLVLRFIVLAACSFAWSGRLSAVIVNDCSRGFDDLLRCSSSNFNGAASRELLVFPPVASLRLYRVVFIILHRTAGTAHETQTTRSFTRLSIDLANLAFPSCRTDRRPITTTTHLRATTSSRMEDTTSNTLRLSNLPNRTIKAMHPPKI
jgi:hypothetical protein